MLGFAAAGKTVLAKTILENQYL